MPVTPVYSPLITSSTKSKLQSYLDTLYELSDVQPPAPSVAQDPYPSLFTSTATLKMGSTKVQGTNAIATVRQNMWKTVTKRHHKVSNVAQLQDKEFLVTGSVEYTLINDKIVLSEFAGHMVFEDVELSKLDFYNVYLDTAQVKAALE